jgi:hypothetical protein
LILRVDKLYLLVIVYTLVTVILQYIGYNAEFVQHQGRYLFPALLPLTLFYVVGVFGWSRYLDNCWPKYKHVWYWLPVGLVPTMAILAVHALCYTIIPTFV